MTTPRFIFEMSDSQARAIHALISSHNQALKNWTASAVESGDFDRAKDLVSDLRFYERLYSAFNVNAKEEMAKASGNSLQTSITVL